MTKPLRMDLIDEYYNLYREQTLSHRSFNFKHNYELLGKMWIELSKEEKIAINHRFIQENLAR